MTPGPAARSVAGGRATLEHGGASVPGWCQVPLDDGRVAALRVDAGDRLEVTAFREGVPIGRAVLASPSGDGARAVVRPLGVTRYPGLEVVLLEHLAAAARRQGVAALLFATAGDDAPAGELLRVVGLRSTVHGAGDAAVVRLATDPTDAYLRAMEEREVHAMSRWLLSLRRPEGVGPSAVVVPAARARAVLDTLRAAGVVDPVVVTAESAGDSRSALAALAGDERVEAIGLASAGPAPQARLAALSRHVGRTKTVVVVDGSGASEGVWAQPGVSRVRSNLELGRIFSRPSRLRRRHPAADAGWSGHLTEVDDLDLRAARGILRRAVAPDGTVRALSQEDVEGLLGAYGVDAGRPVSAAVAVESRPGVGLAATVTVGRATSATSRLLPLTEHDLRVLTTGVGPREARQHLEDVLRRTTRMVDDQSEVAQVRLGPGRPPGVVIGPARDGGDDPWVRRLPDAVVTAPGHGLTPPGDGAGPSR